MLRASLLAVAVGSATTAAARNCADLVIPISITAENARFNVAPPTLDREVTDFILNLAQPSGNITRELFAGYANVSGTYNIAATYCTPDEGPGKALQILTHGIGFDRSYWDFPLFGYNYSYVNAALARGYSTFSYDRLGIGQSSHGNPVNEVQASLQEEALVYLTKELRGGCLPGVHNAYAKTFHVGHSFGSVQLFNLTSRAAAAGVHDLSDGIALTGFSKSATFLPYFLLGGNFVSVTSNPSLAPSYGPGYFATSDESAVHTNFFAPGQFDPVVLSALTQTGQPAAMGELLTIGEAAAGTSVYEGPVIVVTGDRDIPFCGGNCLNERPSIPDQVRDSFSNSSDFKAVVVPSAGHGLNLEYSHPITYAAILDFFDEKVPV